MQWWSGTYLDEELLPGALQRPLWKGDAEALLATELQGEGALLWEKLQRQDSHPHQLLPV